MTATRIITVLSVVLWALGSPPTTVGYEVHGQRGDCRGLTVVCPIGSAPGSDIERVRRLLCADCAVG